MPDRNAATRSPRPARRRRGPVVASVLALAMLGAGCSGDQSALDPAGPYAQAPHDLIKVVFAIAIAVFVLVQGLLIYSSWRYRERADDDGSMPVQVEGNTRLEILWTIIPALILAVIAVPTVRGVFEQMQEPDDALVVEVIGHRWWFEYYYPEFDIYTANEMAIPVGRPVRLVMTAADLQRAPDLGVIHSFWIPRLAGKQDLVPGKTTYLNIQADEPGRYLGQCAEFCGLSHANMRARVEAMDQADFDAWVAAQQTGAAIPTDPLAARGRELFADLGERQACASCHQVWEGQTARGPGQGPDLTHLFSRKEFAGAVHDLDEANLRAWLANPNDLKPMQYEVNGIGMPNLNLTADEIDALVAYLMTLE